MKRQKNFAKSLLTFTLLLSLFISFVPQTYACGIDPILPVFSFELRPDDNLKDFAAGDLGVLKPNYARSYLIIAYRHLNGFSLTEKEQNEMVRLWNFRLKHHWEDKEDDSENAPFQKEKAMKEAINNWFNLRNDLMKDEAEIFSINGLWKNHAEEFSFYQNCTKSAFETAAKTFKKRLEKYGETEEIKNWVRGQDAVFSNCLSNRDLPSQVDETSPDWLKNDRDYQIAAAYFYKENFAEARKRFIEISKDKASEWSDISNYLVARTYFREASFNRKKSKKLLKKAELQLLKILDDKKLKNVHRISRKFLYVFANRLKTKKRFHKFSELLSHKSEISDIYNEVDVYTKYLDSMGFKPREKVKIEKKTVNVEKKELTFWEWIWSLFFGETPREKKIVEDKKVEKDENYEDKYCDRYDTDELKNSMHFCSEVTFKNISKTVQNEDISDWIFTFQSNEKASYEHALKKWKETSKLHWFVAAIANAETDYKETEKLIKHADSIEKSSPAFYTVKFHQVRLLIEQKKHDVAREKLDSFLKKSGNKMPISTQNLFFRQRMLVARNLDEFLHFAKRKATVYSSSFTNYDETSNIGKHGFGPRDDKKLLWRNRWMFDSDSTDIFNYKMPLKTLIKAGEKKDLPNYLRKGILISALTRAILLEDKTAQKKVAKLLAGSIPQMSKELNSFQKNPNELMIFKLLINYPVMQPLVDEGFARFVVPIKSLAYDRDNWWYRDELELKNQYTDEIIVPKFLTAKHLEKAENERKKMFDKGFTGGFLSKKAVLAARKFPNEKELPKLLHKTVKANRYGDTDPEDKNKKYSKQVFQILHKRFPKNVWTRKTPYWY